MVKRKKTIEQDIREHIADVKKEIARTIKRCKRRPVCKRKLTRLMKEKA